MVKPQDFSHRFRAWAPLAASLLALSVHAEVRNVAPGALPTGFQLIAGSGSVATAGDVLDVSQASSRAVFGWNSFDIGAAATVNFHQPAGAVALNLIGGADASAIYGKLNADAQVFLVNPHGVLFGRGAAVNVGGLLATTMSIGAADFMNGNWRLTQPGGGVIRNEGLLRAAGSVALIANDVANAGDVFATTVTLAAGNRVAVDLSGDGLIRARVEDVTLRARIENGGAIAAASVALTAGEARGTLDRLVNNSGIVRATGLTQRGGEIVLEGAQVTNSGALETADGGRIDLRADNALTTTADSRIVADAGRIRLWSDGDTFAHGSFRARRGFIETSGNYVDVSGIQLDAAGGQWLIDPGDVTITTSGNNCAAGGSCAVSGASTWIDAATIATALNAGTSVTVDTAAGSGGSGYLLVNANIAKTAGGAATLTLNADGGLTVGSAKSISSTSGHLNVVLNANRTTAQAGGGVVLSTNSQINTNGGSFTASGSNFELSGGAAVNSAGGALSITANHANGSGLYLALTSSLQSGGGHMTLASNAAGNYAMRLYGSTDAGSGYITLNLTGSFGRAIDTDSFGYANARMVTSGIEFTGNNATFMLGGAPSSVGATGRSVYATGAGVHSTAQSGNPVLTIAGNLTGSSNVYLYVGTPNVAWVSGTGMNTDLAVGSVGTSNGLSATYVNLATANGNISQTQPITTTNLLAYAYGIVPGSTLNLTNAGNAITNINTGSAWCVAASCAIGASATPTFQLTNSTALNVTGLIDAGNGAVVIKTLTGKLALNNNSRIRTALGGTSGAYANAIVLVAGEDVPADFSFGSSYAPAFGIYGSYARYLIYSGSANSITLGGLSRASNHVGTSNGDFVAYYGSPYYTTAFDGSGLPAAPASAAAPNALIFQSQPTLTVTANAASRPYGDANTAFTYNASGLVLGDTAANVLSGALGCTATATSDVGTYPITLGSLATTGYNISYTGADLTVSQRPVSIVADAQTKTYGSADPSLSYQVTGGSLANGDALNLNRAAGETVAGGPYAIGLGSNPNYDVTFTGSHLSITPANLSVTANAKTKVYGSADPVLDYAVSGLVSNAGLGIADTEASVLSGALDRAVGETVAGSPYAIGQGSLTASSNYSLAFTGADFTITAAAGSSSSSPAATDDTSQAVSAAATAVQSTAARSDAATDGGGSDGAKPSDASSAAATAGGQTTGAATPRKDDDATLSLGRPRGRMLVCRKG